ncbi:MAG: hypothetical protein JSV35_07440 [Candidatus Bathyarchaeota archaeon]|nr:MAG: hypothetical protein JSV35_07440 [Candidatus Bathyarchaeota archaeon]
MKRRQSQRIQLAREAAELLYSKQEKEHKQAKLRAAKTLGLSFLPTNAEIEAEIDQIAEEREGSARAQRLKLMRLEALKVMRALHVFNPVLAGSVWRGTARYSSDVDIFSYADSPQEVLDTLIENNFHVIRTEKHTSKKLGAQGGSSFHIFLESTSSNLVEVVVKKRASVKQPQRCSIYGDKIVGLSVHQLETVLESNPNQRFIPT